jgi:hypothetical protein
LVGCSVGCLAALPIGLFFLFGLLVCGFVACWLVNLLYLLFGFGWAMTGACPGPLFAQLGFGAAAISVTIFMAIVGTWVYGKLREKLPH